MGVFDANGWSSVSHECMRHEADTVLKLFHAMDLPVMSRVYARVRHGRSDHRLWLSPRFHSGRCRFGCTVRNRCRTRPAFADYSTWRVPFAPASRSYRQVRLALPFRPIGALTKDFHVPGAADAVANAAPFEPAFELRCQHGNHVQ